MVKCLIPKNPEVGSFVLRLTLGLLFVYGGIGKLFMGGAAKLATDLLGGYVWLAYFVGVVELLAGLFLIIVMVVAIFLAHNPFTMEGQTMNALIRLALIGGLAQVLLHGSGDLAVMKD